MKKTLITAASLALCTSLACAQQTEAVNEDTAVREETAAADTENTAASETENTAAAVLTAVDIEVNEKIENSEDGGHAIEADGTSESYANIKVTKTGESGGDESDFYGVNYPPTKVSGLVTPQ